MQQRIMMAEQTFLRVRPKPSWGSGPGPACRRSPILFCREESPAEISRTGLSFPRQFFYLPGGRLEEPQAPPLGIGVQACPRSPEGHRFIMLEPQDFSHHRRPIHPHPAYFPILLGHRFIPARDQKSCSKTRSFFPLFSGVQASSLCTHDPVYTHTP